MKHPGAFFLIGLVHFGLASTSRTTNKQQQHQHQQPQQVISIAYQDLADAFDETKTKNTESACPEHLLRAVSEAFGPQGLGFLEITDIPPRMVDLRSSILPMAEQLANLPAAALDALTLPETGYTIGWSHGKEQFGLDETGQPMYDTRKGSFYLDPFRPRNNVFPTKSLPQLEPDLLEVTHAMSQAALWVSKLCDAYLQRDDDMIYNSLKSRLATKARLLYYFPSNDRKKEGKEPLSSDDDWCGWHKDHGSLTALLPGMIFGESATSSSSTDPTAKKPGLYIKTRDGAETFVKLPPTSIGIQVGETVEIMSNGKLVATPHAVMSQGIPTGGRASLAVFIEPELDHPLPPCPETADESLRKRHRPTFGAFQDATTQAFA